MCNTEPSHHFGPSGWTHGKKQLLPVIDGDARTICSVFKVADIVKAHELKDQPFNVKAAERQLEVGF